MRIGLIGGIGPAATIVYYRTLARRYAAVGRALPLTAQSLPSTENGLSLTGLSESRPTQLA